MYFRPSKDCVITQDVGERSWSCVFETATKNAKGIKAGFAILIRFS